MQILYARCCGIDRFEPPLLVLSHLRTGDLRVGKPIPLVSNLVCPEYRAGLDCDNFEIDQVLPMGEPGI